MDIKVRLNEWVYYVMCDQLISSGWRGLWAKSIFIEKALINPLNASVAFI